MNKLVIALSAALSLGAVASANAQTGTVNFTGSIVANTCTVDLGGGSATRTIALSPITADALKADPAAGSTPFTVTLNSGAAGTPACDGDTTELLVRKSGLTPDGRIPNTHTHVVGDPAAGAVVELVRVNGATKTRLNLQTDKLTATTANVGTPVRREAKFDFEARYLDDGVNALRGGTYTGAMIFDVANY